MSKSLAATLREDATVPGLRDAPGLVPAAEILVTSPEPTALVEGWGLVEAGDCCTRFWDGIFLGWVLLFCANGYLLDCLYQETLLPVCTDEKDEDGRTKYIRGDGQEVEVGPGLRNAKNNSWCPACVLGECIACIFSDKCRTHLSDCQECWELNYRPNCCSQALWDGITVWCQRFLFAGFFSTVLGVAIAIVRKFRGY